VTGALPKPKLPLFDCYGASNTSVITLSTTRCAPIAATAKRHVRTDISCTLF
jgi:predicted 2-oxoglutarate/Fe(II)-dependent dioxygenase YbiX